MTSVGTSDDDDGVVRCVGCHREARAGNLDDVVSEGGGRRIEHPERAELDAVERWARGELPPIVARCPRCGQPMVGRGLAPIRWMLDAGAASFVVHAGGDGTEVGAVIGPDGATTLAHAAAAVRRAHPRADYPTDPVGAARFGLLTVFQVALMTLMLAPLAVWLFSIAFVTLFLSHTGDP